MVGILTGLLNVLIVLSSLFLICLVLIQRGKGGGLAGAFGAAGGSSAFGTKAGDVFTKVTIITAGVWILMAILLVLLTNGQPTSSAYDVEAPASANEVPVTDAGASADLVPEGPAAAPSGTKNTSPSGTPSSPSLSPAGTPPPDATLPPPPPVSAPETPADAAPAPAEPAPK